MGLLTSAASDDQMYTCPFLAYCSLQSWLIKFREWEREDHRSGKREKERGGREGGRERERERESERERTESEGGGRGEREVHRCGLWNCNHLPYNLLSDHWVYTKTSAFSGPAAVSWQTWACMDMMQQLIIALTCAKRMIGSVVHFIMPTHTLTLTLSLFLYLSPSLSPPSSLSLPLSLFRAKWLIIHMTMYEFFIDHKTTNG